MDYEDKCFHALYSSFADNNAFFEDFLETHDLHAYYDSRVNELIDFSEPDGLSNNISEGAREPFEFSGFLGSRSNFLSPTDSVTWAQSDGRALLSLLGSPNLRHADLTQHDDPKASALSGSRNETITFELVDEMPLRGINTYSGIAPCVSSPSTTVPRLFMSSDIHVQPDHTGTESVARLYPGAQESFEHYGNGLTDPPLILCTDSSFTKQAQQPVGLSNDLSRYITDPSAYGAGKRKSADSPSTFQGCSAFPVGVQVLPKLKRAKFRSERREQVAEVRRKGACLRCKCLKISVRLLFHRLLTFEANLPLSVHSPGHVHAVIKLLRPIAIKSQDMDGCNVFHSLSEM